MVFIIIPTLNESKNIIHLIEEIFSFVPEANIIIVDDNSEDGTFSLVFKMAKNTKQLWPMLRKKKRSFSGSYLEGIEKAITLGATKIIQMDADFSHPPRYLGKIIKALDSNNIVIGSRYINGGDIIGWNLKRKLMSKWGNLLARIATSMSINDFTAGYIGWDRDMLEKIISQKTETDGYVFLLEMKYNAFRAHAKIAELPITFEERVHGQSKMNNRRVIEFVVFCLRLFVRRILNRNNNQAR